MKKKKYLTIFFAIILILIIAFSNVCYAEQLDLGDLNQYVQNPNHEPTGFRSKVNTIISVVQLVGSIMSVIILIIIGIRYMISSVEEKAEYKKTMMGYIIGCVLVFAIVNILKIVYDIATSI